MKDLNISVEKGIKVITVLQGNTLDPKEPLKLLVPGIIKTPFSYLEKRQSEIDVKKSHLIVNQSEGMITLIVNEKDFYCDTIKGSLKINPDYDKFKINTGEARDTFQLADFIKMNRFFFTDKSVAMKLVSELKNFKAKVDKEIELSDNDRGSTRMLQNQIVESNIPEGFDIVLPIFKGQDPEKIRIEINIDSRNFECSLISPDANDIINDVRSKLVKEQVDYIANLVPELAILEV